jgi:glycosyltransferase involved in cell wall biosynthesis
LSGKPVVLVNSAHNLLEDAGLRIERRDFGYGVSATVVELPTRTNRRVGKVLNIVRARPFARLVAHREPALVWIYNSYAFEAKFGLALKKLAGCPLILELEDWPTARGRGLNPKPALDRIWLERVVPAADLVTCVNENLRDQLRAAGARSYLLPSLISPGLNSAGEEYPPFSRSGYTLGYFGGLSAEKGADVILELAGQLPPPWRITVTGTGPLSSEFVRLASDCPNSLSFEENATDARVHSLMMSCDAIVNPHRPISSMGNGIFPFKVFEALASGRLLISTELPPCGLDLESSTLWFDGTAASLRTVLLDARNHFTLNQNLVSKLAAEVRATYSENEIYKSLRFLFPTVL